MVRIPHDPELAGGSPPEFPRPFAVGRLAQGARTVAIEATAAELTALATRFAIAAIDRLDASLEIALLHGGIVRVRGSYRAAVVQTCVVTLEPVPAIIEESVEMIFSPVENPADGAPVTVTWGEDDPPEPIRDGGIDLGEAIAQRLAVALDPYPRALDAGLPEDSPNQAAGDMPFAALRRLKPDGSGGE